ncbi:MAG: hypothetical protein F6J95_027185 [Leptolyngbya sp. SIO1E4]|nr:hypothetical protein [Leptolyngbya sp. SIO1E4]
MSVSDYWHLQKLDSTGQSRRQQLNAAYTWLLEQAPNAVEENDDDHRLLQARLLSDWQQGQMALALLCLRCAVSHAVLRACFQLVSQFGDYYQFRSADLLPFVLDDAGQPLKDYQPFGVHIVETYTPGRASLEGWAAHLTRNHRELNQFLIERGLYRVSDWAILNDTQVSQLARILGEFHRLTEAEITAAETLLSRYHAVYRRDRLKLAAGRNRGRCQMPSDRQLHAINAKLPPRIVLGQLRQLAYWLRQYRIHVRGGLPLLEPLDAETSPELPAPEPSDSDVQQDDFLQAYRQQFEAALAVAMSDTLQAYCDQFRCKRPPKADAFLKALHLFHCEGEGMKAIAPKLGLTNQVAVTRLMNLKRFRADVRSALLSQLQSRVRETALDFTSAEQLQALGDRLDALLAEEADRLIDEAESEAKIPHNRTANSRFARQLCASLQHLTISP